MFMRRACRRSNISRFTARLLWAEASLGAPLGRGFLLMQCVFGFAAAFGCRRPAKSRSVQFNMFIRTVVRFCRYNTLKTYADAASKASPEQCLRTTCLEVGMAQARYIRNEKIYFIFDWFCITIYVG